MHSKGEVWESVNNGLWLLLSSTWQKSGFLMFLFKAGPGLGCFGNWTEKCKNAKSKVDVLGERMMLVCCYQYFQWWKMCLILDTSKAKLGYFGNWTEKCKRAKSDLLREWNAMVFSVGSHVCNMTKNDCDICCLEWSKSMAKLSSAEVFGQTPHNAKNQVFWTNEWMKIPWFLGYHRWFMCLPLIPHGRKIRFLNFCWKLLFFGQKLQVSKARSMNDFLLQCYVGLWPCAALCIKTGRKMCFTMLLGLLLDSTSIVVEAWVDGCKVPSLSKF